LTPLVKERVRRYSGGLCLCWAGTVVCPGWASCLRAPMGKGERRLRARPQAEAARSKEEKGKEKKCFFLLFKKADFEYIFIKFDFKPSLGTRKNNKIKTLRIMITKTLFLYYIFNLFL
jgi:hypothetical protein